MKLIFTLFIALLLTFPLFSQLDHQWSLGIGSKEYDHVSASVVDHAGNVYVMMEMKDSVDIDPGPGVRMIVPEYGMSYVLTKYDPNGNLMYGHTFFIDTEGWGVVMEARHNQLKLHLYFTDSLVYIRNGVRQKLFDHPGFHVALLTTDLDGKIIKSHYVDIPNHFYVSAAYTFPDGHMLIGGGFKDTIIFNSQSPVKLISSGGVDAYMMLVDPNYLPVWYTQFEGIGNCDLATFTVGSDEKIYFAGKFRDTLHVVTQGGPVELISHGNYDGQFGCMSMSGTIDKILAIQGPGYDDIRDIQADVEGNMFIGGQYEKTVNFASATQPPRYSTANGISDGYVGKYDEDGNLVWLGIYPCTGYTGIINIELKRGNELYLAGSFTERVDLNPGPDSMILATGDYPEPFVTKLNTNGEFLWSIPLATNWPAGIRSIHVLTEESRILLTGYYGDSLHLGIEPGEHILDSDYGIDCFFASYSEQGVTTANHDAINFGFREKMEVFPNPAADHITIRSESDLDNLFLYNASGTLIYEVHRIEASQVEIKVSDLPCGIYYLSAKSAGKILSGKFIKE